MMEVRNLKDMGLVAKGPKFKTWQGADKRARFETAIEPGEVARGDRAKAHHWFTVKVIDPYGDHYRIVRHKAR
jgi:hypothetical protein